MAYRVTLMAAITLVFAASFLARSRLDTQGGCQTPNRQCWRIVSLASSVTETLYALGLGDRVVGVTRFCEYPPEVKQKAKIGGYYDPNFEAIVALKPDLVVMLEEHAQSLPAFERLRLPTLVVRHKTVDGVVASFRTIGDACGKSEEGRRMADDFERRLDRVRDKTQNLPRPRVLLALDRTHGRGHLADVYVVGDDGYFDSVIELAGGRNACRQRGVRYPVVASEGILWLNPDVIVDLVYANGLTPSAPETMLADWNELGRVGAVKNHRVCIFDQDYAHVPGPRVIQLLEHLARVLHPEVNWDE